MANGVNPDQTTPSETLIRLQSDLRLHSLYMTFCQKFWYSKC